MHKIKTFSKDEIVFKEGNKINFGAILLEGSLEIVEYDYFGNRSILSTIEPMHLFAENYSYSDLTFHADIIASKDSVVLFFNSAKISSPCHNGCVFHIQLINNLLKLLATNNIILNQKIKCLSKRTTREKLLNFLSSQAQKFNSNEFSIPYDRQALADYLCVERSAMAAEIGKLRNEKIIECRKNQFKLLTHT